MFECKIQRTGKGRYTWGAYRIESRKWSLPQMTTWHLYNGNDEVLGADTLQDLKMEIDEEYSALVKREESLLDVDLCGDVNGSLA